MIGVTLKSDIRNLLAAGESERVEFKQSLPRPTVLLRDIVALANTKGGSIVVGVGPGGRVTGIDPDTVGSENLARYVLTHTDPPLEIAVTSHTLDGRELVVIGVPSGWDKPHTVAGTAEAYVRVGPMSRAATRGDLQRLALEAQLGAFEDAPVIRATLADVDPARFHQYLRRRSDGPLPAPSESDRFRGLLRNLGFATRSGTTDPDAAIPTVAALLLFGRAPQQFLPQARVELARFAGDKPGPAADRTTVGGTLAEQLDGAMDFITRHMRVAARIEGFRREDLPEYPPEVVRELLLNALVHRDYSLRGMAVQVWMFFDRWEITSPGRLPGPLTPADLERSPERLARNPRLAEAMRILGHGEGLGLGLSQARARFEVAGLPPPILAESATTVTVTLIGAGESRRRFERLRHFRNRLVHQGGNPRQLLALEHLLRSPALTNAEYRRLAGVSDVTALRDLTDLVGRGLLVRHGAKRGAYYTLADDSADRPGEV